MSNQLYPSDLTDTQWEYIKPLIPQAKPGGRPRSLDMRQVVNAILYVIVGGVQWRMLPREYPKWQRSTRADVPSPSHRPPNCPQAPLEVLKKGGLNELS